MKEPLGKIWAGLRETSKGRGRTEGLATAKAFPILRPKKTKEIAAMGAQQELWSLVEECSHGRTAAQQEEAQRIITSLSLPLALQSFYSAPQWPGPGSQR